MSRALVLCVLVCCLGCSFAAGPTSVGIAATGVQEPVQFALGDLRTALVDGGYKVGAAGEWTVEVRDKGDRPAGLAGEVPPEAESFSILPQPEARKVWVVGRDAVGAMYGVFELAERVKLGERLERLGPVTQKPYLEFRATNPFLSLPYPFTGSFKDWWFLSEDFWRTYLDMLARARFNWIDLHGMYEIKSTGFPNIFPYFVDSPSFPEAGIDDLQKAANLAMLNKVLAMAAARGIKIGLMSYSASWNVPGAPKAPYPETEENLATYTREVIREMLRKCPGLGMIGFRIGESGKSEGFYQQSYLPGITEAGRDTPLYTRTWGANRAAIMKIGEAYPGRFIIEIKYNGEHFGLPYIVSGGRMATWGHYSYQEYCRPPQAFKIVWQNRANGTHRLFRWGDPEWAARAAKSCRWDVAVGHCIEAINSYYPQTDYYHRDEDLKWYRWVVERDWLWYLLWGRLSYDPDLSEAPWLAALSERFGAEAAAPMLRASARMSRVVPLIYSAHCLGPDHRNMAPEFETGGPLDKFADVQPLDTFAMQSVREYVQGLVQGRLSARTTPLQMAKMLQEAGTEALAAVRQAAKVASRGQRELADWETDITCLSYLGGYYASKLRAATYLELYKATRDPAHWERASEFAEAAIANWQNLSTYTDRQYMPFVDRLRMHTEQFQWRNLLPEVEADREVLQRVKESVSRDTRPPIAGITPVALEPVKLAVTCAAVAETKELKTFRVRVTADRDLGPRDQVRASLRVKPLPSEANWRRIAMTPVEGGYEAALTVTPLGAQWALEVAGPEVGACWPNWQTETPYQRIEAWDGPMPASGATGALPDLTRLDLSRKRFAALIVGRTAKELHAAAAGQKQALLAAVEAGQTLLVFDQDYPGEFDASWLPGGVRGTDADADDLQTRGSHPLLAGLPKSLHWTKVVNDALAGGDAGWLKLTEPWALGVREVGKGRIILVQIPVERSLEHPEAVQLARNLLDQARGGSELPLLVVDPGTGEVTQMIEQLGGYGCVTAEDLVP